MQKIEHVPSVLASATLGASAILLGLVSPVMAQDGAQASGIVLKVHQESTEEFPAQDEMLVGAREAGVEGSELAAVLGGLLGALADAAPVPISAGDRMKLDLGLLLGGFKLDEAMRKAGQPPEVRYTDATIYIRPDLFRMEADEGTVIWRPATPGQDAAMWVTDPSSGQLIPLNLNIANSVAGSVAPGADAGDYEIQKVKGKASKEMLGHTVHFYRYSYTMDIDPFGMGGGTLGETLASSGTGPPARTETSGTAWIAPDMPEAGDIAAFYSNFASSLGGQGMLGGLTSGMAKMAELGVPLETTDTTTTYIKVLTETEAGEPATAELLVSRSTSKSEVTDISIQPLDDGDFFGEEGTPPPATPDPGAPCDCGCDAMKELQDLDEDDPNAMAKAMCAQQCMSKWMACMSP